MAPWPTFRAQLGFEGPEIDRNNVLVGVEVVFRKASQRQAGKAAATFACTIGHELFYGRFDNFSKEENRAISRRYTKHTINLRDKGGFAVELVRGAHPTARLLFFPYHASIYGVE